MDWRHSGRSAHDVGVGLFHAIPSFPIVRCLPPSCSFVICSALAAAMQRRKAPVLMRPLIVSSGLAASRCWSGCAWRYRFRHSTNRAALVCRVALAERKAA